MVKMDLKEANELDKKTDIYVEEVINWDAHKNEVTIAANKSDIAREDIEQFAMDSFQEGWFACKRYHLESNNLKE